MNKLNELIELQFEINWTLIKIGYYGHDHIPPQISKQTVYDYGYQQLDIATNDYILLAQLVGDHDDDDIFTETISKLAKNDSSSNHLQLQLRKWRAYLVKTAIRNLPEDYFEGLLQLTELWVSLGLPDDCPHIIQGRNNTFTPEDYYTKVMYDLVLTTNINWLNEEILLIQSAERCTLGS